MTSLLYRKVFLHRFLLIADSLEDERSNCRGRLFLPFERDFQFLKRKRIQQVLIQLKDLESLS
jgi:hypothetical protein